jgi:hypothetical protein
MELVGNKWNWTSLMKQPNLFIKIGTISSSLLLICGCICYQAGAFDWLLGTSARSLDSGTPPTTPSEEAHPGTDAALRMYMSGSKSFRPSRLVTGLTPAGDSSSDANEAQTSP